MLRDPGLSLNNRVCFVRKGVVYHLPYLNLIHHLLPSSSGKLILSRFVGGLDTGISGLWVRRRMTARMLE